MSPAVPSFEPLFFLVVVAFFMVVVARAIASRFHQGLRCSPNSYGPQNVRVVRGFADVPKLRCSSPACHPHTGNNLECGISRLARGAPEPERSPHGPRPTYLPAPAVSRCPPAAAIAARAGTIGARGGCALKQRKVSGSRCERIGRRRLDLRKRGGPI